MLCKSYRKDINFYLGLIGIGVLSLVFGILFNINLPEEAHNLSMLSGMLSGIGATFISISIFGIIRLKTSSKEKLKAEEIEQKDERNVQILRKSYTLVAVSSLFLFIAITFLFLALDYMIPAFIAIGCIYAEIVIFFISYKIIALKM